MESRALDQVEVIRMSNIIYELKMFSSNLIKEPEFIIDGMKNILKIEGYDDEGRINKVKVELDSVLCYKKTSARFTPKLYDSYDKIVELLDSDWLNELKAINNEYYDFWKPKHFILFLDGIGMYEFIACEIEINEYE